VIVLLPGILNISVIENFLTQPLFEIPLIKINIYLYQESRKFNLKPVVKHC